MLKFRVLGPLEVLRQDRVRVPLAPKLRQVLALLVLNANRVVHIDALIEELWGASPPRSAVTTAQTYIHQLRKITMPAGSSLPGDLIATKTPGYLLCADHKQVDLFAFQRRVWQGRKCLDSRQEAEAARVFRQALEMWQGPALADVTPGRILESHVVALEEQRLRALELRIQADLGLGLHRELIGELRSLVSSHPLNEWFHGRLIAALSQAGRRNDALQAYQNLRATLSGELGLEPSPELQRLQREVLAAGYARVRAKERVAAAQ
jgi:SARP family transcriptional regulator, regulator of embCAB operon